MTIRISRRLMLGVPMVLALLAVAWFVLARSGPVDDRPLDLPATFLGLQTSPYDTPGVPASISENLDSPGSPMAGKLLCWRTTDELSVSTFVLSRPGAEGDVAAAVDALFGSLR